MGLSEIPERLTADPGTAARIASCASPWPARASARRRAQELAAARTRRRMHRRGATRPATRPADARRLVSRSRCSLGAGRRPTARSCLRTAAGAGDHHGDDSFRSPTEVARRLSFGDIADAPAAAVLAIRRSLSKRPAPPTEVHRRPGQVGHERTVISSRQGAPTESLPAGGTRRECGGSGCERRLGCELLTRAAQRDHHGSATATELGGEPAL